MLPQKQLKIAFVIPYFGQFPAYFSYFIETCGWNKAIDFLFFTDSKLPADLPGNVKAHSITMREFNELASLKSGYNVEVESGYKLCDLKPLYGHFFEDYLREYDYWGFCDIDLIFGDLSKVLNYEYLSEWDIISGHTHYLSGPLSLFRNDYAINRLYQKSKDIAQVLAAKKYMAFDEVSDVMPHHWAGRNMFDYESKIESMTHLFVNPKKCPFKVNFSGLLTEVPLDGNPIDELFWEKGVLLDNMGAEHVAYHFMGYKNSFDFGIAKLRQATPFFFAKSGFHYGDFASKNLVNYRSFIKNFVVRSFKKARKLVSAK